MIYNITNDAFRLMSTVNEPVSRKDFSMNVNNGKVYVFGGRQGNNIAKGDGAIYNVATDTWEDMIGPPNSGERFDHSTIITDSFLYVYGGFSSINNSNTNFLKYDLNLNTWTSLSTVNNNGGTTYNTPTLVGDEIVVFSGYADGNFTNNGAKYNIAENKWSQMAAPTSFYNRSDYSSLVLDSSNVLFYGGNPHSGISDQAEIYNVDTDSWAVAEPFFQNDGSNFSYGKLFHYNDMYCFVSTARNVSMSCIKKEQLSSEKDNELGNGGVPLTRSKWYYIYKKK